ncbi:RND family efflux transporter MFP subunit [Nitratireductor aquibiodomus RA22]|uniref:RND family efflux transporter MFP subunit n=1 Tax=Nitratireductor aquibiodomus RA22 TaxID=1189611 RepID=I5BYF7_9HYPH|nr:efflux RND transporter periplasmic adaptor subunit [Nitratireductor aquibiodomus]EIM74609.1 RND family efflux transporter MFP subunit [Nitratireductor aquibiodomus RA22]
MSFWKQAVACLIILTAAAFAWFLYYPGAQDVLARAGLVSSGETSAENTTTRGPQRGGRGGGAPGPVVTAPITHATINDRLSAIGTGRALRSVVVNPLTAGTLVEIAVTSGAEVKAGDLIARLDSDSEEIALDRAVIALDDARATLERIKALRTSNTVSVVQQNEAELALRNAELAKREAELALERRSITAPIDGTVGILPISAGSYVTSSTEIASIDDRSQILVDFWIPERYADLIDIGSTLTAASVARASSVHEGEISAIDNRIDPESRTLRIEGRIDNPDDRLRAGMAFTISMRFPGETYPAIDPLAIQWSSDGPFVWTVENGMARQKPVRIIQRNADSVLVDAEFGENDLVVTQGIHNVREGAPVETAGNPANAGARLANAEGSAT